MPMEQQPSRFYRPAGEEDVWQPGESLPSVINEREEFKAELHTMISSMQASITSELSNLKDSISSLEERMTDVEAQITSFSSSSMTSQVSTPACSSNSSGRRKRNTPLQIQVCSAALFVCL